MGALGGEASAEIDAPIERCWEEVADIANAPDWQEGLTQMDVVETGRDGRPSVVDSVNDAKVREIKSRLEVSYSEPRQVSWVQDKGDLKSVRGSWTLEGLGDGRTRATYTMEIDPGRVIGMLVRGPTADKLRELLVEGRPAELKRRVEGS